MSGHTIKLSVMDWVVVDAGLRCVAGGLPMAHRLHGKPRTLGGSGGGARRLHVQRHIGWNPPAQCAPGVSDVAHSSVALKSYGLSAVGTAHIGISIRQTMQWGV